MGADRHFRILQQGIAGFRRLIRQRVEGDSGEAAFAECRIKRRFVQSYEVVRIDVGVQSLMIV